MPDRAKSIIQTVVFSVMLIVLGIAALVRTPDTYSVEERRRLMQAPELSADSVMSGELFEDTEEYLKDQFPLRRGFITAAGMARLVLGQRDSHGVYVYDGMAVPIGTAGRAEAERLAAKLNAVTDMWFSDSPVYIAIAPDKACFFSAIVPAPDYEVICDTLMTQTGGTVIPLTTLDSDDYYNTDHHWRQECLIPTAELILDEMGREYAPFDMQEQEVGGFIGVYGSVPLPLKDDTIVCLTDDVTDSAIVRRAIEGERGFEAAQLYYPENINSKEPYDVYLGGACTVITVYNPLYTADDRTLYLFGDSYSLSIAPLLLHGYSQVVIIDIRYTRTSTLAEFTDIREDGDVLYLYGMQTLDSAGILNTD